MALFEPKTHFVKNNILRLKLKSNVSPPVKL